MNDKFCTNCGAPLSEDSAFCTKCGAPVGNDDASQSSDTAQAPEAQPAEQPAAQSSSARSTANPFLQPSSAQRTTQGLSQSAPTQSTTNPFVASSSAQRTTQGLNQSPSAQPTATPFAQPSSQGFIPVPGQGGPAQSGFASNNKRLIIILAVVVAVGLVIILFSLVRCSAPSTSSAPVASVPSSSSASLSSATSSSASSASANLSPEKQNAVSIYEKMAALDARISACANEFNENFMKPDRALRERYAQTAEGVYTDAISLQTTISAMSTGGAKELGEDTGNLRALANDLVKRIGVIEEAWSRSLEYADPAPHESYILAPIVADNEGGTNKYYKHFKDNYSNWNPINS